MLTEEYYKMAEAENEHWWYRSLHHLVFSQIKKHFNTREIRIIDAGCGTGGLIGFMLKQGYRHIEGFDISDTAVRICTERNIPAFKGDIKKISEYYKHHHTDVIVSNDTFYYLDREEQKKLADDMNDILTTNGLLITNMPSLKAFSGIHDLSVGISKRFERTDVIKIFDPEKYEFIKVMYWPFVLSPFIWMNRYRQRLKIRSNATAEVKSDVKKISRPVNELLYSITKTENQILNKKPFGSSLFLVMKKIN